MSPYSKPAPRGFRWADAPTGRAIVTVFAIVSLLLSLYVGYRYVGLIDCLRDRDAADAVRTKAIADATDVERRVERELIMGPRDGVTAAQLRKATLDAYARTDRIRAANPAPSAASSSCE